MGDTLVLSIELLCIPSASEVTLVAMIRAIILASLSVGAMSQQATGLATCPCIGLNLWTEHAPGFTIDCSWAWGVDGTCVRPTGLISNFTDYPGDYGTSCKIHLEPGHAACADLTLSPPEQMPQSQQASWCNEPWCYIDPCNCDASDGTKSDYFPGALFYSTATCGSKNTYTALESATNTVGNAECAQASDETASDAHSLQMGFGLALAGMGAYEL